MSKLTDDGVWVLFKQHSTTLFRNGEEVLTVPRIGNLYQLDEVVKDVAMKAGCKDWHAALGHPCEKKMKELQQKFPHLNMAHPDFCESCVLAKQRQQPYPLREDQYDGPLEFLHLDLLDAKGRAFVLSYLTLSNNRIQAIHTATLSMLIMLNACVNFTLPMVTKMI